MIQTIHCNVHVVAGSGTRFWTPGNNDNPHITAGTLLRVPAAGTLRNLRIRSQTAIPGSGTDTTTMWHNGVASALSVALNSGTQEGTDTDSVSVAEGDTIEFRTVTNSTAGLHFLQISIDYEATDANVSWVMYAGMGDVVGSSGTETGLFYSAGGGGWDGVNGSGDRASVAGTITNHHVYASAAPGAGNTRVFTIYKNGVAQDGTGGTPDTRVTISGSGSGSGITFSSATFTLMVAAHDELKVTHTATGTPSTTHTIAGSCRFLSGTTGAWNVGAHIENNPSTTATNYAWPFGRQESGALWSATESVKQFKNGPTAFSLSAMRIDLDQAPGTGKSYTFTFRKNGAATGLTVTLSNATVTASVSAAVSLSDGDVFALESVPFGTPSVTNGIRVTYSFAAAQIIGSSFFGADGTVNSSRTVLMNLDGVTRTVNLPNTFALGGSEVLYELAAAPTGVANAARLYAVDNGSGKTRLMVVFATGAAVQLAIEP